VLIPFDDYPVHQTSEPLAHAGDGHPDQYDRFWFNGYTEDTYFAVALGLYPNRGVIDAAFAVVRDGVQRSVFASGRIPDDRTRTTIGPVTVRVVEPMRVSQVLVDAPEHGLRAELTARARTAAVEEERAARNAGTRRAWDATRATQLVSWTGWLSSGPADRVIMDGAYGTKDRSWGIRPVGTPVQRAPEPGAGQLFFLWSPVHFDDVCLHYMVHEDSAGVPWARTAALLPVIGPDHPGVAAEPPRPLGDIRHERHWLPGTRRAGFARLHVPGEADPVELEPLLTFRMKGAGYFHPEWAHGVWHDELAVGGEEAPCTELDVLRPECLHVQQVVRARWGSRTGLGILEQGVLGPYAPAGFTEMLDGAR
jgi:hypothetical protein